MHPPTNVNVLFLIDNFPFSSYVYEHATKCEQNGNAVGWQNRSGLSQPSVIFMLAKIVLSNLKQGGFIQNGKINLCSKEVNLECLFF